jgi:flagellar hook-associated protein 1 FlgK
LGGDLTLALKTMQSGLAVNQVALNTVANNVANVHSEGYSRKVVQLEHRTLAGIGAGVQIAEIGRRVDDNLMKTVRIEAATFGRIDVQQDYLARTQDLFGSPESNTSLAHTLSRFAAAVETLAVTPEGTLEQNEVVRLGRDAALQVNGMSKRVQELRQQADGAIAAAVDDINRFLSDIVDVNNRIVEASAIGDSVAELEDRRDSALDQLAALVDIRVFKREHGDLVVFSAGGRVLVDNTAVPVTHHAATGVGATTSYATGGIAGIYAGATDVSGDITGDLRDGRLAGLVELRDRLLPDLQSSIDTLAAALRDTVNRVHNRGVPFPGLGSVTGSRAFDDPLNQSITLAAGDVRLVLLDADGRQVRTSTLGAELGGATGTIEQVRSAIDTFLDTEGSAAFDAGGHLAITLGAGYHLAFRDENTAVDAADVTLTYDADVGDLGVGKTVDVEGFSSFFGFNDFFVDGRQGNLQQSRIVAATTVVGATTLAFRQGGAALGSVAIGAGSSLDAVAQTINAAGVSVTATVVPEGSGVRLRLAADNGVSFAVIETGGALLTGLGVAVADTGTAETLAVRQDIVADPARVSRGSVRRGADGAYAVGSGDSAAIAALAAALGAATDFPVAGTLGSVRLTFVEYAGTILGDVAARTDSARAAAASQQAFVDSLRAKSDAIRGVNLDEEMTDLILYEQAYSAAARLISVVQSMFEALDRAVG